MLELNKIYCIDALEGLHQLPDESIHCCVTSPPYWGLRDYGIEKAYGLEPTFQEWMDRQVEVFREVFRILRKDGTLWVNMGDGYTHNGAAYGNEKSTLKGRRPGEEVGKARRFVKKVPGLRLQELIGMPWRLAFALQDIGWRLRMDNIWHKPNPMPESVTDRCTRSHEYVFHFAKGEKYYYDTRAIATPYAEKTYTTFGVKSACGIGHQGMVASENWRASICERKPKDWDGRKPRPWVDIAAGNQGAGTIPMGKDGSLIESGFANRRSVWTMSPSKTDLQHHATFPVELPDLCISAGCPPDGIVLDFYMGVGTTAISAGYRCDQSLTPEYEWFKLSSLKGLTRQMQEHVKRGGLQLKKSKL